MSSFFRSFFFLALVAGGAYVLNCQDAKLERPPSGLVLEVYKQKSVPPSLTPLYAERPSGFWASGFSRINDWKLPPGEERVQAVRVQARLVDDKAEVVFSVFRGKRFAETDEVVATLKLAADESATVSELGRFGFEPFLVKVVRRAPTIANVPLIVNPVSSLGVTVSPMVSTLSATRVKLANNSEKPIFAVVWHTEMGGYPRLLSSPQGQFGRALIESRGEYQLTVQNNNADPSAEDSSFVIDAVIYADGSIDGDKTAAARILAFIEGRRKALSQLVPILKAALGPELHLPDLIAQIDSIETGANAKTQEGSAERVAFRAVMKDVLKALRELESASTTQAETIEAVRRIETAHGKWLDRLPK